MEFQIPECGLIHLYVGTVWTAIKSESEGVWSHGVNGRCTWSGCGFLAAESCLICSVVAIMKITAKL